MDYFDDQFIYASPIENIKEQQIKEIRNAKSTTLKIDAVIIVIIMFIMFLMFSENAIFKYYLIPIGVGFFFIILVHLITPAVIKKRLIRKAVYQEVVDLYNREHDDKYVYSLKPKLLDKFNQRMGLFTRFSNTSARYRIDGEYNGVEFSIINCTVITSTGKSTQVHFDGFYIIIKNPVSQMFQIRTDGKPSVKGVKFERNDQNGYRTFVEVDSNTVIDSRFTSLFEQIMNRVQLKRLYIGSDLNEFHIAITPDLKETISEEITQEEFNRFYDYFSGLFNVVKEYLDT